MPVKQIIVMRRDLRNKEGQKVRTGKLLAQACHASLAFLLHKLDICDDEEDIGHLARIAPFSPAEVEWLDTGTTKVVLGVDSEKELYEIYRAACDAGIMANMVTDAGRTEFEGPTKTCIALGPDTAEALDPITGHLKLL
jgi:PTH2 family peptidyl-tRNA hydrolase